MITATEARARFEKSLQDIDALLDRHPLPELNGARIFGTGCTGFVGYWLLSAIESLNRRGQSIEFVALSRDPETFLARYPEFAACRWLVPWAGNVTDFPVPEGRFDWIIHGASDTSPDAAAVPAMLLQEMGNGTRRMIESFSPEGCRGFLLLSSGAVYGEQPAALPAFAEDHPFPAESPTATEPYAKGKRLMERECAGPHGALPAAVIARCFAFLGPQLPEHLAPSQLMRDALADRPITIRGDGTPQRSYLYAADLALWLLALLVRGKAGRAYNVGGDEAVSIAGLAELVRAETACPAPIRILGSANGEPRRRYIPDTSRARRELGLDAWTPLATAISRMADSIRGQSR
jgi:nucleoside-diphosphate-sugar epimerase